MSVKTFNINTFHRLFLQLFKESLPIFDDYVSKKFVPHIFTKEENEKFTSLDWVLQKNFEIHLENNFPKLNLIGEEDTKETHNEIINEAKFSKLLALPTTKLANNVFDFLIKHDYLSPNNELNLEDCCIYVDPIDSTTSFIKHQLEPVTSLVGLSYKGMALLGLVFFPRYKGENNPVLFFNIPQKGIFKYSYQTEKIEKVNTMNKDNYHFLLSLSKERSEIQQQILSLFNKSKTERAYGIGNKMIKCIRKGYFYMNISDGIGFWDVCAGHALIKEAGGNCLYRNGEEIKYPRVKNQKLKHKEFIVSNSKSQLGSFLSMVNESNIKF